jgi:citrate synthase
LIESWPSVKITVMGTQEQPRRPLISDIMSQPSVTALADETIATAAGRMSDNRVGSVVVVDGGRPIGILTERDLVRLAAAGAEPGGTKVVEWMTANPDTVGPDLPVDDAWRVLAVHGYRHIPVVDNDHLVGVASMRDLMTVAQIRPVQGTFTDVPRGLKGVVVTETELGDVRGLEGFFHYRQYSGVELAEQRTLEDVWQLLVDGNLPNAKERAAFIDEVRPFRKLPVAITKMLPAIAAASATAGPLDGLRTALSAVAAAEGLRPSYDLDRATLRRDGLRISAVTPTVVALLHRLAHGLAPIEPDDSLGHAANYLWMVSGEKPDPALARAIEQYVMLTVDHGFNASTFTARVIASTGADLGAAVVGALGALSGPLHGGAPSRALDTLEAIGSPDRAADWIRDAVARGERIMGFGHAVYKTDDPRSVMLRTIAQRLGGDLVEFAVQVEQTIVETLAELKPGRQLYANVEYYAGVVMAACGLPPSLFTPTFAIGRVIGWCANVLEQAADNRIIRPSARYIGEAPPQPVPVI